MTGKVQLNRRNFLAANAAAAAAVSLPQAASACKGHAAHRAAESTARATWATATSADLAPLIGDRFRVSSDAAGELVMRLVAVEKTESGPHRPKNLARSETFIAVFDSPDKAPLVGCGHQSHRVSHPALGAAEMFFGPICKRSGGHVIEMVLG